MTTILLSLLALIVIGFIVVAKRAAKNMPENFEWINAGKKNGAQVGDAKDAEAALPPALGLLHTPLDPFHVLKYERALNFEASGTPFLMSRRDFVFKYGPGYGGSTVTRWKFYFAKFTLEKSVPHALVMSQTFSDYPDNTINSNLGDMVNTELEGEFGTRRRVYVAPGGEAEVREWLQPDLMSVILEHPGICIEVSGTTGYCFGLASTLFREEEFVRFVEGTQAIIKEHMD